MKKYKYNGGGQSPIFNHMGMKVPGMINDGGSLGKAKLGGPLSKTIQKVFKGIPASLKRLFKGKSNLKSEAQRVSNTFKNEKIRSEFLKKYGTLSSNIKPFTMDEIIRWGQKYKKSRPKKK
jgi:hypothetical protein